MLFSCLVSRLFFFLSGCQWVVALYFLFYDVEVLYIWNMFNPYSSMMSFYVLFDATGTTFSAMVLLISASVFFFASYYMKDDPFGKRFIILVILFVMSMNFFIFIPHMMGLLLGWDGLGLVSFCLVIYYQNAKSLAGGMLTVLSNRIGDVMILIAIALSLDQGHWLITTMFDSDYKLSVLVLIAGMTKSAQLPFSSWLPAAMAAPTPVSALVHSSTLVTAGVFLLIRFYEMLSMHSNVMFILLVVSSLTMVMAGMAAMIETDMKKVIALSTLSQLGVMMMSLALGLPTLAFFHLLTHALFKALLFMAVGSLIYMFSHKQDMRSLGNLCFQLPVVSAAMLTSNLALMGFPFMAGFYSKDVILEHVMEDSLGLVVILGLGGAVLTAFYSIRLMWWVLWKPSKHLPLCSPSEDSKALLASLVVLSVGSVFGGSGLNWLLMIDCTCALYPYMKILPLILIAWGALLAWILFSGLTMAHCMLFKKKLFLYMVSSMWFFTPLSTQPIVFLASMSEDMGNILDHGWLEMTGPQGIYTMSSSWFSIFQSWSGNIVFIFMLLGVGLFFPLVLL